MKRIVGSVFFVIWANLGFAQESNDQFSSIPITMEDAISFSDYPKYLGYEVAELEQLAEAGDVAARKMLSEKWLKENDLALREQGADVLLEIAQQGYVDAQHDLASEYWFGRTISRDQNLAILWYRQALRGGSTSTAGIWANHYDTQSAMFKDDGTLLQPDVKMLPDQVKSLMWQLVAFKMGYPESSYDVIIPRYQSELSVQEFADAEAMADQCYDSGFVQCGWPER